MDDPQIIVCTKDDMLASPLRLPPGSLLCAEEPLTIQDFCELADEDTDAELIEGVVVMKSPVSYAHEALFGFLHKTLGQYVEERGLGEVLTQKFLVRVTEYTGREPDLMFVGRDRLDIIDKAFLSAAPDLIMEIVSPHDRPNEILQKRVEYEQLGVRELWIIDQPKQRLTVLDLGTDGRYRERPLPTGVVDAMAVPGFHLQVDWLWCEPRGFPSTLRIVQDLLQA